MNLTPKWRTLQRAAPAFRLAVIIRKGRDESRPGTLKRAPQ
jgi:hypothetical protein